LTTCFGVSSCESEGGLFVWGACDTSANVEVCDGLDNDCDGVVDEGFKINGKYAADDHCGMCGINCSLKWSVEEQHVLGVCDPDLPEGPDCVIGECVTAQVGGGTPCSSDADCAGDPAGPNCLPGFFQCGKACDNDFQCAAGACVDGWCSPACQSNGQCHSLFGQGAECVGGHCRTTYQYVDLDDWTGNGCECPAAVGLQLDEPDLFSDFPLPGASYVDRNCDGIDGDLSTALFVSGGFENGDGSPGSPFGSIQQAVEAFVPGVHSHILVATGSYAEQVVLVNGSKLFGGYAPDFSQRDIALFPTVIAGPVPDFAAPPVVHGTVNASNITQETVMAGFTVYGYDVPGGAESAGQASYALYVSGSSDALLLANNWFLGGQGAPGKSGENGASGTAGGKGKNGLHSAECINGVTCTGWGCNQESCSGHSQPGGLGGTNPACPASKGCSGMESEGGESPQVADNPAPGCSYSAGGYQANYSGGASNLCKYDCYVPPHMVGPSGITGVDGSAGNGGAGCQNSLGTFSNGDWVGGAGLVGSPGGYGTGGQGGSSGANVSNSKSAVCSVGNLAGDLGASGGGGGSGACGGLGGHVGQSGGATVAVLLASGKNGAYAVLSGNLIARGYGGAGGPGGNGGSGGKGGAGGAGGGGGGGCGGPSIGLAVLGTATAPYVNSNGFSVEEGQPLGGPGGPGGLSVSQNNSGTKGQRGGDANAKQW